MKANTKIAKSTKEPKANAKRAHGKADKEPQVESEFVVRQLNRDVRDSVLVVSILVNAYLLVGWLVLQVTDRFDASLISYLQSH